MLLGPVDFEVEKEPMTVKNIEFEFRFFINLEKWLREGGIFDWIESAIEEKKSLKESGLVTVSPMYIYIGIAQLHNFVEMRSQMDLYVCMYVSIYL